MEAPHASDISEHISARTCARESPHVALFNEFWAEKRKGLVPGGSMNKPLLFLSWSMPPPSSVALPLFLLLSAHCHPNPRGVLLQTTPTQPFRYCSVRATPM